MPPVSLSDYTADQLLAEVKRRAERAEQEQPIERWCQDCDHWRYSRGDDDTTPNCLKLHTMSFRMPEDYPDSEEWGHYRRDCADFIDRSPDAPGPDLTAYAPKPAPPAPPPRRSTRQPARHADAVTVPAPAGAQLMLRPMHQRPKPGQRFAVYTKGGLVRRACHATRIMGVGLDAIVIYHGKYALDESEAIGWWPERAE